MTTPRQVRLVIFTACKPGVLPPVGRVGLAASLADAAFGAIGSAKPNPTVGIQRSWESQANSACPRISKHVHRVDIDDELHVALLGRLEIVGGSSNGFAQVGGIDRLQQDVESELASKL